MFQTEIRVVADDGEDIHRPLGRHPWGVLRICGSFHYSQCGLTLRAQLHGPCDQPGTSLQTTIWPNQQSLRVQVKDAESLYRDESGQWSHPAVIIIGSSIDPIRQRQDGGLQLCVECRDLNLGTIESRYPLPLIAEMLDKLSGSQFFTELDLWNAYHPIRI